MAVGEGASFRGWPFIVNLAQHSGKPVEQGIFAAVNPSPTVFGTVIPSSGDKVKK